MLIGASIFPTEYSIRPDELARLVEERGFESLWFTEHTHIPVSRSTPAPGAAALAQEYWHTYDPFVALTAAAAVTTRLKVGTAICLLVLRDPITTAKEVASLDRLSNGRFIFGISGGWNAEEMANHGTVFKTRWRLLRERVLAMKEIWTVEEPEFHGEFVSFDKLRSYPKPVQKPHPPILMGGNGPTTFDRVIDYCDGWIPVLKDSDQQAFAHGRPTTTGIGGQIAELRRRAEAEGRDPQSLSVTVCLGNPNRDTVERMKEAGADRVVFHFPPAGRETVLPLLDEYTALMR